MSVISVPPPFTLKKILLSPFGFLLALVAGPARLPAGMDAIMKAVQQSEFRFARTSSPVPFAPLAWIQNRQFGAARFEDPVGSLPDVEVRENTFNFGAVLPAYVSKRNMILVGGDMAAPGGRRGCSRRVRGADL